MTITRAAVLRPRQDLVVEAFDDALLLWDEGTSRLHHLDSMAALVWEELDGRALGQVAEALAEEFGAPFEAIWADLVTLGERLVAEGLILP